MKLNQDSKQKGGTEMKVLVTYQSSTGNTRKVAEAIYGEIDSEKEIKDYREVESLDGYDLAFLGFPIHAYGPDKKARRFLETKTKGRDIVLFITHASPEDWHELPEWLEKFKDAAEGANILGLFDCQGELARGVKFLMRMMPGKPRAQAKIDNSEGQPDLTRLDAARVFTRDMMARSTA
jgi:flavodoxin